MCFKFMYVHFLKFKDGHSNASLLYWTDSGPPSQPCTLWKQRYASVVTKLFSDMNKDPVIYKITVNSGFLLLYWSIGWLLADTIESYAVHPNIFYHHDICKHKYKNKIKKLTYPKNIYFYVNNYLQTAIQISV